VPERLDVLPEQLIDRQFHLPKAPELLLRLDRSRRDGNSPDSGGAHISGERPPRAALDMAPAAGQPAVVAAW
jgi:hypothetical protein